MSRRVPDQVTRNHVPDQNITGHGFYRYGPDASRKVYALARLSFNLTAAGRSFEIGDELQDHLPADVLYDVIENGEGTYDKREAKQRLEEQLAAEEEARQRQQRGLA